MFAIREGRNIIAHVTCTSAPIAMSYSESQCTLRGRLTCASVKKSVINTMRQVITLQMLDSDILIKDVKIVNPGLAQFTTATNWSVEDDLIYKDRATLQNNMASAVRLMVLLNAHMISGAGVAHPPYVYISPEIFKASDVDKCMDFCKNVSEDSVAELEGLVDSTETMPV